MKSGGGREGTLDVASREGLAEGVTFESKDWESVKVKTGRVILAEGPAGAKTLSQD